MSLPILLSFFAGFAVPFLLPVRFGLGGRLIVSILVATAIFAAFVAGV